MALMKHRISESYPAKDTMKIKEWEVVKMAASFLRISLTSYLPRGEFKIDLRYLYYLHNKNALKQILCILNTIIIHQSVYLFDWIDRQIITIKIQNEI